jgi:predicted glycosyltransferase
MSIPRAATVDRIASRSWQAGHEPTRPLATPATPKILLYSHDTFGLGNIRRSILLGELLTAEYPNSAVLLVTGSPMIHAFRIPERMDYVKLPCVNRVSADRYAPRFLVDCADEVRRTRSEIIEHTAVGFCPDLFVVDKRAAGIDGELLPALEALSRLPRPPRVVLGLRDILDAPALTRQALRNNGSFETIERYYDEVWIYGSRAIFDAVVEYDFPPAVRARTRYCGYLRRRSLPRPAPTGGAPRVLVTTGGGADGDGLIRNYLTALAAVPPGQLTSLVILGPQLEIAVAESLKALAADRPDVQFVDFEADLTARYAEADVVVSMAGYNTVCELLTANVTAVLVPRAEPVQEQLLRARCLAARNLIHMVEPSALTPARLLDAVRRALAAGPASTSSIDMEGLARIRNRVDRLLDRSGA